MSDEINLNALLPETRRALNILETEADFLPGYVMAGGSALSVRLEHRMSEDLDFFTYDDAFDKQRVYSFFRGRNHRVVNDTQDQIDLIFEGVKITFFNANWPFLKPETSSRLHVATLSQLAAMKVHTLFLRATYRDYYDLYILSLNMSLGEMYQNALLLMDGLNYKLFSMALIYVDDIVDENINHLHPRYTLTKEQISGHFVALLKT